MPHRPEYGTAEWDMNLAPGERVAIFMRNHPAYLEVRRYLLAATAAAPAARPVTRACASPPM